MDRVQKTIAALLEAVTWIRANRTESVKMIAEKFKITTAEAERTYETLVSMFNKDGDCRLKLPADIWICCAKKDPSPPISTPRSSSIFPCCQRENNNRATEERLLDPQIVHYGRGMEIKHGLISADSHAAFDRDDFTRRMSVSRWQDRIPRVLEVEDNGRRVHRWTVYDGPPYQESVCNCPALMGDPFPTYPERWEEVPRTAYDPRERLKALDSDRVDAEVLFPNPPGGNYFEFGDAAFELDVVRAYNDALGEWARISDRYLPVAILPYLSDPNTIAGEVARAVSVGHRGVNVLGQMPKSLPHLTDPRWDPVWSVCQELGVPIHFHGSAGLRAGASVRKWSGYSPRQAHSASTATSAVTPAQIIPQLIFSSVTERFPRLKCVFAEAGIGGLNYVIAACDHEWECRHLWTEGIATRPSDTVRRQMYVNFWFEAEGIKLRHHIGIDNIMWESDFPHVASFYPRSWESIERVVDGVPPEDRRKLLYENAVSVYGIEATASGKNH